MTGTRVLSYASVAIGALLTLISAPLGCFALTDSEETGPGRLIFTAVVFALGCLIGLVGWAGIRRKT